MYNRFVPGPQNRQSGTGRSAPPPPRYHTQPPTYSTYNSEQRFDPEPPPPASGGGGFKLFDIFKNFNLGDIFKNIDKGDLILMLILVLLFMEDGEELESLIIIGLVFILGL